MNLLQVENVSFGYGEKAVLRQISFNLSQGDFLAVVGPNGCGKTTLLHTISAALKPQQGRIMMDGQDISLLSEKQISQQMAFVSQSETVIFDFSVEEVIYMGRLPHLPFWGKEGQQDELIVQKALQMTNTCHLRERLITNLSGGERQRVLIARALAQEPRLLLLDEPTSHLDILHQLELMDILQKLNHSGMTVVAALHDLNLALRFATKVLLMAEGRIIALGRPEEVLSGQNIRRVYGVEVQMLQAADGRTNIIPL
ncbi:MAG: ABC transporter ATP-binding protein [Bacillota bacterium]|jgi:iron complex transport system ATP-binding protein